MWSDIVKIIKLNLKPKRNLSEHISLFEYSDSIAVDLPLSHFKSYYEKTPAFLEEKQALYLIKM